MVQYDVLILGSGIGGSITASILARKGWKVLLVDSASHPRFAIGEATTPDISFRMKIIAKKYDVPEIQNLTTFHKLRDKVSAACGIKRSFSFLYHREGEKQNPNESHQFPTLAPPFGPDCHFFRQDTDAYMVGVALDYGADIRQRTQIDQIDFSEEGVTLTSSTGEQFQGKFLVDAAGYRSPVAKKFGLRDETCRLKTKSRALFTHMIGVKSYDEVGPPLHEYQQSYPFNEGTLHHMFDGGWMWIIPFNNHAEQTNPLCSVGLMLNEDVHPSTDMEPAEEFQDFLGRYPDIAEQFADAKPVRDWTGTCRIQYSSSDIVGDRYCLLAHSAGFVDPLFSSGLNLTMSVIDKLVPRLDQALRKDQFEKSHFQIINDEFQENFEYGDRYVANAYQSFGDFDLWDACFRLWVAGNFVGTILNVNLYLGYEGSGDKEWLSRNEMAPFSGTLGSRFSASRELFEAADKFLQNHIDGMITASEAATSIRSLFEKADFLPSYFQWHRKDVRSTTTFTLPDIARIYAWYNLFAPKAIRDELMSCKLTSVVSFTMKDIRGHRSRVKSRKRYLWDTFFAKS